MMASNKDKWHTDEADAARQHEDGVEVAHLHDVVDLLLRLAHAASFGYIASIRQRDTCKCCIRIRPNVQVGFGIAVNETYQAAALQCRLCRSIVPAESASTNL